MLVTGASRSIGFGIARGFVDEGTRVAITGKNLHRLQKAALELKDDALACPGDLTRPDVIRRVLAKVDKCWGGLDILILNLGSGKSVPLPDSAEWNRVLELNLVSAMETLRQATSPLREPAELEGALAKFEREKLDSLFSGAGLEHKFIWQEAGGRLQSWNYDFHHRKRRQDLSGHARQYIETGSFYVTRPQLLRETRNRLGGRIGVWPVPFWKNFEIDSVEDLRLCEQLMKAHHLDQPSPQPI